MTCIIKQILSAIILIAVLASCLSCEPAETGQIQGTNIYAIKNGMVSVFLIKTAGGSYIMIDAGTNQNKLEKSLEEANINANDIKWIFLTHSDYDHVASLPLFAHAQIYISEDELPIINTERRNRIPSEFNVNDLISLTDNQELLLDGVTIKSIKTPGHTHGHMAFLINDKYLFSGDAFKVSNGNVGFHQLTMDKEVASESIEKIREILSANNYLVLTSHYGYHEKINFDKKENKLRHELE